ncbi:MAG TPA: roadblock/LC7 domain-containing protein [Longimicrobiales bacterium]
MIHGQRPRSLGREDLGRLETLLLGFVESAGARCAVLMDRSGRLLTMAGRTEGIDGVAFASLAAADFAASDQLARLMGEEECTSLVHQGDARSMFLADVDGDAVLAAVFDDDTTLGLVRLKAREVAPELAALFAAAAQREPEPGESLAADWASAAASEIDRLFSE